MVEYKNAVEVCIAKSDYLTNEVIRMLYFERNPNLSNEGIAMELHIDRATLYRHRDRFFEQMRKEIGWWSQPYTQRACLSQPPVLWAWVMKYQVYRKLIIGFTKKVHMLIYG